MMRLELSTDYVDVLLPKVVVSVFAEHPSPGRATIDLEILTLSRQSVRLAVDDPEAEFRSFHPSGEPSYPYTDRDAAVGSYLRVPVSRVMDHVHRDVTGDENHFVVQSSTEATGIPGAGPRRKEARLSFTPLNRTPEIGKVRRQALRSPPADEVVEMEGTFVLGGWCRIERNLPGWRDGGIVDRLEMSVTLSQVACGGLYIWLFAPRSYRIDGDKCEVIRGHRAIEEERVSRQNVSPAQFSEFRMWNGMVVGRDVARNYKRVTCDEAGATLNLKLRVSSPALDLRRRRESYLVGAGLALSATIFLQSLWPLIGSPEHVGYERFIIASLAGGTAFILLLLYGYRSPA